MSKGISGVAVVNTVSLGRFPRIYAHSETLTVSLVLEFGTHDTGSRER